MLKINEMFNGKQPFYDSLKKDIMFKIRCCIPGIIQSYDKVNNTAEIQPSIREPYIDEEGTLTYLDLPLLINVPIIFPSSSKFKITFPLEQNDEVLVFFSDLSIDNFWLKGNVQNPIEFRRHDLSDGIAIPCNLSLSKVSSIEDYLTISGDNCKIQFINEDIKFETRNSQISIDEIYSYIHSEE